MSTTKSSTTCVGIPFPIVKLNRWVLLTGISTAIIIQQPIITTLLFFIILSSVVFGKSGSLIFFLSDHAFLQSKMKMRP